MRFLGKLQSLVNLRIPATVRFARSLGTRSREISLVTQQALLLTCGMVLGCSGAGDRPEIGEVSGIVTFDGEPLANAGVAFSQPGFRPSVGQTDDQGTYELFYIRDIKGAAIGTHVVQIKQFGQGAVQIPRRYNYESELSAEVNSGQNTINFDLSSNP